MRWASRSGDRRHQTEGFCSGARENRIQNISDKNSALVFTKTGQDCQPPLPPLPRKTPLDSCCRAAHACTIRNRTVVLGGARRERRQRAAAGRVVSVSHEGNDCFPGTPEEVVVISIDSAHQQSPGIHASRTTSDLVRIRKTWSEFPNPRLSMHMTVRDATTIL
jgi:hypothetical protein